MSIAGGVSWEQVLVPLKAIALPWVLLFLFYMFLGVDIVFHGVYVFFLCFAVVCSCFFPETRSVFMLHRKQ